MERRNTSFDYFGREVGFRYTNIRRVQRGGFRFWVARVWCDRWPDSQRPTFLAWVGRLDNPRAWYQDCADETMSGFIKQAAERRSWHIRRD